jgi:Lectin C-type domain
MRLVDLAALGATLCATACLRTTEFHCTTNADCGASGVCAPMGLCSIADSLCPGGLRYSDTAGSQANECVGGGGGVDAPTSIDGGPDAPPAGCPAGYNTIPGGQGTHRYRLLTATDDWQTQRAFCAATTSSGYLAIPDDLTELQAIATLGAANRFWLGISDLATENVFLSVKNLPQTFLPWEGGQPNDGPPSEDCVEVESSSARINDERCNTKYVAVCECEP